MSFPGAEHTKGALIPIPFRFSLCLLCLLCRELSLQTCQAEDRLRDECAIKGT